MPFETGTSQLTCPKCGTVHNAKWERMTVREHQIVRCHECFAVMVNGASTRDYLAVEAVKA